jgi:hypothetical protein
MRSVMRLYSEDKLSNVRSWRVESRNSSVGSRSLQFGISLLAAATWKRTVTIEQDHITLVNRTRSNSAKMLKVFVVMSYDFSVNSLRSSIHICSHCNVMLRSPEMSVCTEPTITSCNA